MRKIIVQSANRNLNQNQTPKNFLKFTRNSKTTDCACQDLILTKRIKYWKSAVQRVCSFGISKNWLSKVSVLILISVRQNLPPKNAASKLIPRISLKHR